MISFFVNMISFIEFSILIRRNRSYESDSDVGVYMKVVQNFCLFRMNPFLSLDLIVVFLNFQKNTS